MDENIHVFQFDDVSVEPAAFRVWKAGALVPLEPKAFEVLLFLIQNRGRVVQKHELLNAVWKGTHVSENALTREIALVRKALGEEARHAKYIETVPTRGYRFIAELRNGVTVEEGDANRPEASSDITPPSHSIPSPASPTSTAAGSPPRSWRGSTLALIAAALVLLCAFAVVFLWSLLRGGLDGDETVGVRRLTQVTTSTELDTFPSISPDGGYVAYSSNRGGSFEIYVKQLAPGGREIQITSDGAHNFQPAWSPDGRYLAYYSQKRRGVWLVPALGGVARKLTGFGSKPAWSRDGRWIAFQSARLPDLSGLQGGALPPSTIWIVSAQEGGEPRQITKVGQPSGGHGAPVWWPDGGKILFYSYDLWMNEIWSVSVETGELQRLAPNGQPFSDLVFSPDGRYIYCAGMFKGSTFGLWRVPVTTETGQPAGDPEKVEGTGATPIRYLSISADGKKIVYSTQSLVSNIWQVALSPATAEATSAPAPLFEDTSWRKTNPAFSPDGRRVAFNVWRLGVPASIWAVDADGRNPAPLTTDNSGSGVPNWLPGGDALAFITNRQGRMALWTKNLATGEEKPLTELPAEASLPRLSPDGRRVAFNSRRSGVINVWTQEFGGGEPRQLTFDDVLMGFPCWSPDGRWLALEVQRGDDMQVAVMPAGGGQPVPLTSEPGLSWPHSFSPDGERIAFAGMRDGIWNLYWVSRSTREQKQLTNFAKSNVYVRYPTWSPLGDKIAFEYAETTGNVWLMELK